jgi:uncharacterized protein with ATP-grasp and redox domains
MFREKCMKALECLDYSDELKLAVVQSLSLPVFEKLGGNEDIYYDIKGIVNEIAQQTLEELL